MTTINNELKELIKNSRVDNLNYKPVFYRLVNENEHEEFQKLLKKPGLKIHDELHGQLRELVKSLYPKHKFQPKELDKAAWDHIEDTAPEKYGVWVYYPWINTLVHILDRDEYISVRTNRNQFKITPEERDQLSKIKIGVIGLSVGQSVAIALSMERSYGELRIADFDMLELSNLNRIRSGIQDLGILKTISTARQIAEIDPFLNVKCFNDGLTEGNIESFFLDEGKLDMVLDECDGLDIKIRVRHKAKELGVPLIMETSDRGMIDIERFDLEPDRPILHGLIDHLESDPDKLIGLSNEEKVPYLLPMIGLNTMSDRLKASMLELDQTITTWPQLASDVILGGAASANVCRRIALNQFKESGRFFVDLNEIVSKEKKHLFNDTNKQFDRVTNHIPTNFKKIPTKQGQLSLNNNQLESIVKAGILAPSGGNSQPWQFVYEDSNLYLLLDKAKGFSYLDQDSAGARAGLGAAAENIILKAHEIGLEVNLNKFPAGQEENPVAVFQFFEKKDNNGLEFQTHKFDYFAKEIGKRFTSRKISERSIINSEVLSKSSSYAESIPGASVVWLEQADQIKTIAELAGKIDRITLTNQKGHNDFINEIRWSKEEAEAKRDGIELASVDITAAEEAGFRVAKKWSVIEVLNKWKGGSGFEKLSRKSIENASAVGLICMPNSEMSNFFDSGRALERLWFYINSQKVSVHPMTAITFMIHQLNNNMISGLDEDKVEILKSVKADFYNLFQLKDNQYPMILIRVFLADKPEMKSLRRPINEVLKIVQ